MNIEEYFNKLDSPMKEISLELRRVVIAFSPELEKYLKQAVDLDNS